MILSKERPLSLLFVLLLIFSCLSYAQDDLDIDYSSMDLEDLLNVTVSVTRESGLAPEDAPGVVLSISADEFERMGIDNLKDILAHLLIVARDEYAFGDTHTIQTRNLNEQGATFTDGFLLTIDGNALRDGYADSSNMIFRRYPIHLLQRVEVLIGPASAYYGSNGFMGVINLVSKDVEATEFLSRASNVEQSGTLLSKAELGKLKINTFLSAVSRSGKPYTYPKDYFGNVGDATERDDETVLYMRAKMEYGSVTLDLERYSRETAYSAGVSPAAYDGVNRFDTSSNRYNLRWTPFKDRDWKTTHTFNFSQFDTTAIARWEWHQLPFTFGPNMKMFTKGISYDGTWNISESGDFIFGLDWNERGVDKVTAWLRNEEGFIYQETDTSALYTQVGDNSVVAAYAQYKHTWKGGTFYIGGRGDDYKEGGFTFNPKLTALFKLGERFKIKLDRSTAFRSGSIERRLTTGSAAANGNPDIEPEEIVAYSAGLYANFERLRLGLNYYNLEGEELVVVAPDPNSIFQIYVNAGTDESEGLELFVRGTLSDNIWFRLNHSSTFDNGDQFSPADHGSAVINWNPGRLNMNVSASWYAKTPHVELTSGQGGYTILNAHVQYELFKNFNIGLFGKNIADEDYGVPESSFGVMDVTILGESREIFLTGSYKK